MSPRPERTRDWPFAALTQPARNALKITITAAAHDRARVERFA
jgi:hypothetical protein